jgi:hypothetical protein
LAFILLPNFFFYKLDMGNCPRKPIHPDLRDWLNSKNINKSQQENIRQQFDILCNILHDATFKIAGKKN